ncbi:MAG: hypothetical protein AAGC70_04385 [Pseudomonadota bacterium]
MDPGLTYHQWMPGMPPDALSSLIFSGHLVLISDQPAIDALCHRARQILSDVFDVADAFEAATILTPDQFRKAAAAARKAVRTDAEIHRKWSDTLRLVGYHDEEVYCDRMSLRVVPGRDEARSRFYRPLPPHRDTWGSGILAQVNWWLPLYPLAADRTMWIWPQAFSAPVANTSADWDYDELVRKKTPDYPLLPEATEQPSSDGLPVLIEPGTLLAFSGAHMHASTHTSRLTRFSLDTRSVWMPDVTANRGAPDVDHSGRPANWAMFERGSFAADPRPEPAPRAEAREPDGA